MRSVAFVAPTLTGWLLPLYEAALLTARLGARVSLHTPEETPLEMFGDAAVARALADAGVEFLGGRRPGAPEPDADRIVSLPLVRGPELPGVPTTGLYGLIPIDAYCRVIGLPDAYAVGDATDYPLKQGGIACQQADTAAAHIAAPVTATPFVPRVRATLLTGGEPIELGRTGRPANCPGAISPRRVSDDEDRETQAACSRRRAATMPQPGPFEPLLMATIPRISPTIGMRMARMKPGDDETGASARLGGMSAHGARK